MGPPRAVLRKKKEVAIFSSLKCNTETRKKYLKTCSFLYVSSYPSPRFQVYCGGAGALNWWWKAETTALAGRHCCRLTGDKSDWNN